MPLSYPEPGYGNLTQQKIFNIDLLPANARVYNYTYASFGPSSYIRNRLAGATYTAGGQTYTLVQNYYDGLTGGGLQDTWAANPYSVRLHDSTYSVSYTTRGNLTYSWKRGDAAPTLYFYDLGGNVIRTTGGGGPQVDATSNAASSFVLPSTVTPNSETNLSTSMQWDSLLRLTSVSGPDGVTTIGSYDPASRPASTTSKFGAVTNFTYSNTAPQVVATINGRWSKTYYDGLGRTVRAEAGSGVTLKSIVETVYGYFCPTPRKGKIGSNECEVMHEERGWLKH